MNDEEIKEMYGLCDEYSNKIDVSWWVYEKIDEAFIAGYKAAMERKEKEIFRLEKENARLALCVIKEAVRRNNES